MLTHTNHNTKFFIFKNLDLEVLTILGEHFQVCIQVTEYSFRDPSGRR